MTGVGCRIDESAFLSGFLALVAFAAVGIAAFAKRDCARLGRELVASRELFELANDPVLVADIVEGRLMEVNGAACDLLGYSRTELLKRVLPELHPRELRSRSAALIADVWEKKGLVYQLPMVTKGGEKIEVEVSAKVFTFHDKPSMLLFARDIRERIRLQQQLSQSSKMASLGKLVAGVAHEINTPLGSIHANADVSGKALGMIHKAFDDATLKPVVEKNKRLARALKILDDNNRSNRTASQRIVATVDALRNFARLDESERKRVDLHEGLESTLVLMQHELRDGVEIVKDYGELPEIECWPNELNQVFMCVLLNAVEAIEGDGTITIATELDGDDLALQFRDTGRGIADEDRERIFDPGFTRKGVGVGTGLGLSTSYQIVERHGGRIDVDSEVGKGTTVTLRIPRAQK